MTVVATDNFNRTNSGTLGANWATQTGFGTIGITGNAALGTIAGYCAAYWTANSFNSNQYAQIKHTNSPQDLGPIVRSTALNFYVLINFSATEMAFFRVDAGVPTQIGSPITMTISNGDTVTVTAIGDVLSAYLNSTLKGSVTDSSVGKLTSGAPGISSNSGATRDDFVSGNTFMASWARSSNSIIKGF